MPPAFADQDQPGFDPSQMMDGLKRHLWLPLTLALIGLVVGYSYYKRQRPLFEALSVAEFGGDKGSILGIDSVSGESLRDEKSINTLIQAAKSRDVIGRVVAELGLAKRSGFTGGHPDNSKEATDAAINIVSSMIRVSLRKETRLIDFLVTGEEPEQVAAIANKAAASLVAELESQKSKTMQGAVQSLVNEGQRLQKKLKDSEIALHDYKRKNEAISLDERKDLVLTKLKELGADLNRQSRERLMLETHLQACKAGNLPREQMLNLPTVANHPKVSSTLSQIGSQKAALAVLSERYKPKHPKYQAAQSVVENLEKQLDALLGDAVGLLQSSYNNAQELERKQQEQLKQQELEVLNLEQLAVQYNVLKREMESDQAVYESVLARIKQVDVSKEMETIPIWVHQLAMVPMSPVSPDAKKTVATTTAGGFMLGMAVIGLMVMHDRSIRTIDDARLKLRLPVMGAVNEVKSQDRPDETMAEMPPAQMALKTHHHLAEAMREFRTIITRRKLNVKSSILITSAIPGEGKTFVSTHLAISMASQGLRTLLIDMDLRRRSLNDMFGVPGDCHGVADLLLGGTELRQVCFATGIPNLAILPAGRRACNSAELLASASLGQLKEAAFALGFDRIIVDSAPLIPVSDTLMLGDLADELYMVVRCNRTPSVVTLDAISKLHQTGIRATGLVLNRLKQRLRGYDYYYHNANYSNDDFASSEGRPMNLKMPGRSKTLPVMKPEIFEDGEA